MAVDQWNRAFSGDRAGVTKWPDTPNEEARVSDHFKSHT